MESRNTGRFNRHSGKTGVSSASGSAQSRSRFRRRGSSVSGNNRTSAKRFRPHSSRFRSSTASSSRGVAGYADAARRDSQRQERSVYAGPVYPPYQPYRPYHPFIPPAMYTYYDLYGKRLSRAEIAEMDARERYEDRYGRDFNRYSARKPSVPSERREIFPRDYLLDSDE